MSTHSTNLHFIFAAPFSGGRTLMSALNHHPQIFATELRLFGGYTEPRGHGNGTRGPRLTFDQFAKGFADHFTFRELALERREFVAAYVSAYAEFVLEFIRNRTDASLLIDTLVPFPGTSRRVVDAVCERFPDARILVLNRDGRDVVTESTFDTLATTAHGTDRFAYFVENRPHAQLRRFFDDHSLTVAARNWAECIKVQSKIPENALAIHYEDLINTKSGTLERILDFFGVEPCADIKPSMLRRPSAPDRPRLRFEADSNRARGDSDTIWQDYFTSSDGALFEEIAGQQLRRAGYEKESDWFRALSERLQFPPRDEWTPPGPVSAREPS